MEAHIQGLLLNHTFHPQAALGTLCENRVEAAEVPQWEKKVYQFILEWLAKGEHILQRSSGTTGESKELLLPKRSMVGSALNTCRHFDLRAGQSALLCLPVDYIAGKMMVVRALLGKLNLLLAEPSSAPELSGFDGIDFCAMVPLQVMNSLKDAHNLRKIKKLIIGGTEISPELEQALREQPVEAYATYGMAETCSHVAIRALNGPRPERPYTAMPGVTLGVDARNCLVVESAYLENEVVTNDIVDLLDSRRFHWRGRYDNLINSGGVKIVPEELEAIISQKTGLACAILGLPDAALGEKIVLVLEKNDIRLGLDRLKEMVQGEVPRYSQPKEILFVDRLPRNRSFKVDRRRLIDQLCP